MASSPLIRRLRDSEGKLVTYLPAAEIAKLVGLSKLTITRWGHTGAIRQTSPINRARNYSVADAARLRAMPRQVSLALGIVRKPVADVAVECERRDGYQTETLKTASQRYEHWTAADMDALITMLADGMSYIDIAARLNRTYGGIQMEVGRLRQAGELPTRSTDTEWWARTSAMLTAEEIADIEGRSAAA